MSIRVRIFLGILLVIGVGFFFLVDWIVADLTPQYREATEEPLVDAAHVMASLAATTAKNGEVDVDLFRELFEHTYSQSFTAQVYKFIKTNVDFRVYITDAVGTVIFDSDGGRDEGQDYSKWRDVKLTLEGEYGARTSRDVPEKPKMSVLYVAAPITDQGEIIGVLTVAKPTTNANQFIESAEGKITFGAVATAFAVLLFGIIVTSTVTHPINKLTLYARAVRDGQRGALPALGRNEIGELGQAFEEMRMALEGKKYIENYVQTLTHEIKSPLSAIQGAVELLKEELPPEKRDQFLENIDVESGRIRDIVEKLLLLAALEARTELHETELLDLYDIVADVKSSIQPLVESKQISITLKGEQAEKFYGEAFLVRQAVHNLIQNAAEFTPESGEISLELKRSGRLIQLLVRDTGPGIPEYALERIYERFYSLKRPHTGKKSSGLGLTLVQEVASLHGGAVRIGNRTEGGVQAVLEFPVA